MKHLTIIIISIFLFTFSCSEDSSKTVEMGTEGGKCFEDKTCNDTLYCDDQNLCKLIQSPCDGIKCSNNGVCEEQNGKAICICNEGFYPDNDKLECNNTPVTICLNRNRGEGPYTIYFTDVTAQLGIDKDGLSLTGSNIVVSDINRDNWPDILATKGSKAREDINDPKGRYRLLLNQKGTSFIDHTWESNLFKTEDGEQGRATSFVIFGDINNDRYPDAFNVVYSDYDSSDNPDQSDIFLNNGDGTFERVATQSFSPDNRWDPTASALFLDYDKDGFLDLFVAHHYGRYGYLDTALMDTLHKGDGSGNFQNVTISSNIATESINDQSLLNGTSHRPSWGATSCDLDGDGWSDILVSSYGRQLNTVFRNNQGSFENLTIGSGFEGDQNFNYNNDQFFACYCYSHQDSELIPEGYCDQAVTPSINCSGLENSWDIGFSDQIYRLGGNSSNSVCADFDNDGDMDILSIELAHWHIGDASDKTELLYNEGFPENSFVRPGRSETGLERDHVGSTWDEGDLGGITADFDNDGKLDIVILSSDYPNTTSLLYQQQNDGTFSDITDSSNIKVDRAHGGSLIDYDRDGDYDIIFGTSSMRWSSNDYPAYPGDTYTHLLRNDGGQIANKVMIHIEGSEGGSNMDAVGAKIVLEDGDKKFVREVQGGYGLFGFQHDPFIIIGIGDLCEVERMKINWPNINKTEQIIDNVKANYVIFIKESEPIKYYTLEEYRNLVQSGKK